VWDVVLELALLVPCWLLYQRSLPDVVRGRSMRFALPIGLAILQCGFGALQSGRLTMQL